MHHEHDGGIPGVDPCSLRAFRAFKRAMMLHRRLISELFAEIGVHPSQAGCLHALAHHDGLSQSDLADVLHVSRPTVTSLLQRLEASGLIERRTDEIDSRVTRVYLTDAGRAMTARLGVVFAQMTRESLGGLTPAECEALAQLLEGVNEHVAGVLDERGVRLPDYHAHGGAAL